MAAVWTGDLGALKGYMRVTHDLEDDLIQGLADAAAQYLEDAGIFEPASPSELYSLAVYGLVLHWYDNRNVIAYNRSEIPMGLRPIINQLKHSQYSAEEGS